MIWVSYKNNKRTESNSFFSDRNVCLSIRILLLFIFRLSNLLLLECDSELTIIKTNLKSFSIFGDELKGEIKKRKKFHQVQ